MRSLSYTIGNFLFAAMLICSLSGCGDKDKNVNMKVDKSNQDVDSVLVLPVATQLPGGGDKTAGRELAQLAEGSNKLSAILEITAQNKENLIFLSANRMESLLGDYNGSAREIIRYLGKEAGADAVLQTYIFRYRKRVGSEYSVSQPASVSFSYRLVQTTTGSILCQGQFDETQQPLFEDLFSFFKASGRGFKWITAEKLLEEGVEQKFNECSHLNEQ